LVHGSIPEPWGVVKEGKMKWEPWLIRDREELKNITEPPCRECLYFNPVPRTRKLGKGGHEAGVLVCIQDTMYHDFSCYKGRE
jgi:hypothetical protein